MTIVVGYSPSGQGRAALHAALRHAVRVGEDLVVASHLYNDPETGPAVASEQTVLADCRATGLDLPEITVRSCGTRDVGEFLLDLSEELEATLVVIGLHRKSPIGKLNLGASARRVVLGASCPVLAVKDDPTAAADIRE
ncbi:universal stress protein [Brachybacterium sp. p3-SID957]|uniref:universal stress protein n=1 Tax=Brachybacterium sp. p3-SID957 TaxID=2916049 RepID=UPI00223AA734|nr:universal stress protein [Brachybacterium sp. p3-SID957]MCT1776528.1 universal stress protein [Brachybacterium sp. p3-SID957]